MEILNLSIVVDIDHKFWSLLPALNLNLHSKTLELEFLCFGIYINSVDDYLDDNEKCEYCDE